MKSVLSKATAYLVSAALVVSLCPGIASAHMLEAASTDDLARSTVQLVSPGPGHDWNCSYDDSLAVAVAAGRISFDAAASTLTLNGVSLAQDLSGRTLIWAGQSLGATKTLTVRLVGASSIKNTGASDAGVLLDTPNAVRFTGTGSLAVDNMACLRSEGSVRLDSGTFRLTNGPRTGCIETWSTLTVASTARLACKAKGGTANAAKKMANSYKSITTVSGALPVGAEFATKAAVYKVVSADCYYTSGGSMVQGSPDHSRQPCVSLKRWLSGKSASFKGGLTKLAGARYRVAAIESDAFNNRAGRAVKKITLNPTYPMKVKKYAFRGTKGLTSLYLYPSPDVGPFVNDVKCLGMYPTTHPYWFATGKSSLYSAKAFAGAGKASGKKLKVYIMPHKKVKLANVKKLYKVAYGGSSAALKKYLGKMGLSKQAAVVVSKKTLARDSLSAAVLRKSGSTIERFV